MGWIVTLGIIFLLAILPLGVRIRYNSEGLLVKLILGPVKLTVLPRRKKKRKESKQQETAEQAKPVPAESVKPTSNDNRTVQASAEEHPEPKKSEKPLPLPPKPPAEEKKTGGSLLDFLPLVMTALELLGDFRRKLRINDLFLRLILGGSDPCDLAVSYGKTWTAVGNLMPQLERLFVIKKRDVEVECDFTASETTVIARADITITLGRLLALIAVYGIRALKEYLTIQKKRKGGAVT